MRPLLHFTPMNGWMNDPNGLIYYKGQYHLFYQHFPYTCKWGTMHWGHAISDDLYHFTYLPIALYPSKNYDRNGCFSGSAIEKDNKLYLYYTSIKYAKENPENVHVQYSDDDLIASQSLVISEDGMIFDNVNHKQKIIDVIQDAQLADSRHTRDPKVWIGRNDHIYMILGSKFKKDGQYTGEVLFYESQDGIHFEYKNRYFDPLIGDMWECPDLFNLENSYFMIFSPEHINQPPQPKSNAVIMQVDFDESSCTIKSHEDYMYLDYGLDFYAPQTFIDEFNQRVVFGWMRMQEPIKGEQWCGMLSLPRVLTKKEGHIYQNVHQNIQNQFVISTNNVDLHEPFYMRVQLNQDEIINLGGLKLYIQDDCLVVNRKEVTKQHIQLNLINQTPPLNQKYNLEIYYDHHIVEIYINEGYYVLSQIFDDIDLSQIAYPKSAYIKLMKK